MHNKQKTTWSYARVALFWVVGLMNTVWVAPEAVDTWTHYIGYAFLVLATIETIVLVYQFFKKK